MGIGVTCERTEAVLDVWHTAIAAIGELLQWAEDRHNIRTTVIKDASGKQMKYDWL
jgi:hypothetical protein